MKMFINCVLNRDILNCNIGSSGLNNSKLHLNAKGTAYLAVNFIKSIRQKKPKGIRRLPRQGENFHKSQLLQLGSLLILISLATQPCTTKKTTIKNNDNSDPAEQDFESFTKILQNKGA